jgi:hypothetical protein
MNGKYMGRFAIVQSTMLLLFGLTFQTSPANAGSQ